MYVKIQENLHAYQNANWSRSLLRILNVDLHEIEYWTMASSFLFSAQAAEVYKQHYLLVQIGSFFIISISLPVNNLFQASKCPTASFISPSFRSIPRIPRSLTIQQTSPCKISHSTITIALESFVIPYTMISFPVHRPKGNNLRDGAEDLNACKSGTRYPATCTMSTQYLQRLHPPV